MISFAKSPGGFAAAAPAASGRAGFFGTPGYRVRYRRDIAAVTRITRRACWFMGGAWLQPSEPLSSPPISAELL
jgi:hypothetical protein